MSLFQFRDAKTFHIVVIGLVAGSGCAALIYEIVWFQMLELVLGSSSVSLGILLGTFMGGLCLGSLLLPYIVSTRHNPLWIYAVIETVIGCIGIALMLGMGWIANVYAQTAAQGLAGILQRGLYCAALLILPTMLMGAALPCLARLVRSTPDGMARLGRLYASNIIGAIAGCVLAGFYLLRLYDMPTATYFAAAVNAAVATFSAILALATQYAPADREPNRERHQSRKQAAARSLAGLPDDRAVRADRARRRGDLDPAAFSDCSVRRSIHSPLFLRYSCWVSASAAPLPRGLCAPSKTPPPRSAPVSSSWLPPSPGRHS